ncbi:MAG: hypothetical protein JSV18_01055 [Candidatus Bathyarchaeota archaeon]|nr:MAG: hypothetical protein JSV18_01055 [Candidatus Bathyarchaeota archaeon]
MERKDLFFIAFVDIKPGLDEEAYEILEGLKGEAGVEPLLIGRIFERADILLLLHSEKLEALDDYLIRNVRKLAAAEELVVVPIYEFTLLPSFNSVVELDSDMGASGQRDETSEETSELDEFLLIVAKIDIAPGMDRQVHQAVVSIHDSQEGVIPLIAGHTFHSKEFDLVLFFLSRNLDSAWKFGKRLRSMNGVWDTELSLIAHFEALAPLERLRELASAE